MSEKDITDAMRADAAKRVADAEAAAHDEIAAADALDALEATHTPPPVAADPPPVVDPAPPPVDTGVPAAPPVDVPPAAAPAPGSNPPGLALVEFDPATGFYAGDEHTMSPVFRHAGEGRFGLGTTWVAVQLPAGSIPISTDTLGVAPLYGITKQLYVLDKSMLTAPPDGTGTPPPVEPSAPAAPSPAAPVPAAPAPDPQPVVIAPSASVPTLANLTPDSYGRFVRMNPAYKPQHVSEATLAALTTVETPGTPGEMVMDEGGTGYRPELGFRALGAQLWATTMDPRAKAHMYAEADLAEESFPIHATIQGVVGVPKPWLWSQPQYVPMYDGQPFTAVPDPLLAGGIKVDGAHFPQFLFDATCSAAIEGDTARFARYLEQMKWVVWFNFFAMSSTPQYCQGAKYIINSLMGQQRGNAWNLRDVDDLVFVLENFAPNDDWLQWLAQVVDNNIRFNDGVFRTGDYDTSGPEWAPYAQFPKGGFKNSWGITRGRDAYSTTAPVIALWQQGFQSAVLTRAFNRNHPSLSAETKSIHAQLVTWLANLWIMIMGPANDPNSFDYRRGVYEFPTGTFVNPDDQASAINFFQTPAEFRAYYDPLGPLGPDDFTLRNHADNGVAGLPGGFTDNLLPAAAVAVDAGVPGVLEPLQRILNSVQGKTQGGDLAFSWLHDGFKWTVDDGAAPVVTPPPVVAPPVTVETPPVVDLPVVEPVITADMPQIAGTGDAAWTAAKAIARGTWLAFKDSDTIGRALSQLEADFGYKEYGASGNPPAGVTSAWSGASRYKSVLYFIGGGHKDTNFNGCVSMDLEAFKCDVPVKPSVISPDEAAAMMAQPGWFTFGQWVGGGEWFIETTGPFVGRKMPGPMHTYNSVMGNAAGTKVFVPPYLYDLAGNSVSRDPATPGIKFQSLSVQWGDLRVGMCMQDVYTYTLLDPDKGTMLANATIQMPYVPGQAAAYIFDPAAYPIVIGDKLYTIRLAPSQDDPVTFKAPLAWSRDLPFPDGPCTVDVLTPTLKNPWPDEFMMLDYTRPDLFVMQPGAYFQRQGILYIMSKDNTFALTWNPLTGECGKETARGAVPPPTLNGPYGRLFYYEERDMAALVNAIDEPLYAVRFWD